jgi:hypothetical protein
MPLTGNSLCKIRGFLGLRLRKLVRNMIRNLVGNLDKPKDTTFSRVTMQLEKVLTSHCMGVVR